jgi:hypothetical protein
MIRGRRIAMALTVVALVPLSSTLALPRAVPPWKFFANDDYVLELHGVGAVVCEGFGCWDRYIFADYGAPFVSDGKTSSVTGVLGSTANMNGSAWAGCSILDDGATFSGDASSKSKGEIVPAAAYPNSAYAQSNIGTGDDPLWAGMHEAQFKILDNGDGISDGVYLDGTVNITLKVDQLFGTGGAAAYFVAPGISIDVELDNNNGVVTPMGSVTYWDRDQNSHRNVPASDFMTAPNTLTISISTRYTVFEESPWSVAFEVSSDHQMWSRVTAAAADNQATMSWEFTATELAIL